MKRVLVMIGVLGLAANPVWAFLPDAEPAPKAAVKAKPKPKPKPKPKAAAASRKPVAQRAAPRTKDCAECPEMVSLPSLGIALGKYEVTVGQYRQFVAATGRATREVYCGSNPQTNWSSPGFDQGDDHPVVCVSWEDATAYTAWLSDRTGQDYRLPSEDEWQTACLAGSDMTYCGGESVDAVAWYQDNAGGRTHPVGRKQPNGWGLYDMSGNVWEWTKSCWDGGCWERVVRGGSWGLEPARVRVAERARHATGGALDVLGFRVARTLR
ncbi:formylglycine-generating enzyme family protein [Methylolobus aquaticus]